MNNIMTELQAALRELGHDAEPVQNAPVDMLNVWLEGAAMVPDATVMYESGDPSDHGQVVWGHHWEHQSSTAVGAHALAALVVATCQEEGKDR